MKELPILMSTDMVRAIIAGRKTETRRVVKRGALLLLNEGFSTKFIENGIDVSNICPYGQPGDVLYVREKTLNQLYNGKILYRANVCSDYDKPDNTKWKPSIHMPKAAARIWLQVTEIKVERLHEITEESAVNEGVDTHPDFIAISEFSKLWKSINGPDSWAANPWVWVVKFKVLSTTGKPQTL